MNLRASIFIIIVCSFVGCQFQLPPNFNICKQSDPDLNECLIKAIQNALTILKDGYPSLNFPPIQPMVIPKWTVPPGEVMPFDQKYENVELHNIPEYKINRVQTTITDTSANFLIESFNSELNMIADYNFENAIILGKSVSGKGKSKYIHDDIETDLNITGEIKTKGNSKYLTITDFQMYMHVQQLILHFDTGDAERDKEMNKMANDYWLSLFLDRRAGYGELFSHMFKLLGNALFSSVPFDVLFPKE